MNPSSIGVRVLPGQTALIRTPALMYSSAAARVRPMTPCLLATYAGSPANPTRPAPDDVFTIEPPPWATIGGISCFNPRNTPVRLRASTRFQSSRA